MTKDTILLMVAIQSKFSLKPAYYHIAIQYKSQHLANESVCSIRYIGYVHFVIAVGRCIYLTRGTNYNLVGYVS